MKENINYWSSILNKDYNNDNKIVKTFYIPNEQFDLTVGIIKELRDCLNVGISLHKFLEARYNLDSNLINNILDWCFSTK